MTNCRVGTITKRLCLCRQCVIEETKPRSQALSSLPPLVVGRKTLVAAGHVTTQNLGGKKICWAGGVAECFVAVVNFVGFKTSSSR